MLYDLHDCYNTEEKYANEIWDALQKKYDIKEAGSNRYVVSRYMKFQMTNEKSVEAQSHELHKIVHGITSEGMPLLEEYQIAIIIDKLPP